MSVRNMHNVIAVAGTIWTDQRATLPRHNSWFVIVYRAAAPLRCPDVRSTIFAASAANFFLGNTTHSMYGTKDRKSVFISTSEQYIGTKGWCASDVTKCL
jgi:hypothetical protein